jgi:D-3-phosphoglycerate dehydrogenase / 2-oxoglutarate reductase
MSQRRDRPWRQVERAGALMTSTRMPRVLVADPVAEDGIEILNQSTEVDVRTGLKPDELAAIIGDYDALVVRSETKVTAAIFDAGHRLQVVGRAGVGVDNIDLDAATQHGVVVVNAPTGNTTSAAELAVALMLALARHIPAADASLKGGQWQRSRFVGIELRGKTLGIIGLGQVGSEVARRARSFEMRLLAFDPFVPEDRARALGVEVCSLETLLESSDFVTVHTTLTPGTRGLIGPEELQLVKPTVRLINTARGGIIDEESLAAALREGRVAGAAVDVFTEEPATANPLIQAPNLVTTPHLGASTAEAQERVAVDVAEQIAAVLRGEPAQYAVNAPMPEPEAFSVIGPYIDAAAVVASVATQLSAGQLAEIEVVYNGEIALHDTSLIRAGVIRGLLQPISEEHVTAVNANLVAERRGLRIVERRDPEATEDAPNQVTVRILTRDGNTEVAGTVIHGEPRISIIDGLRVDVSPRDGVLLLLDNEDRPGRIGAVGQMLGEFDINISSMTVGRRSARGRALMVLGLDEAPTSEQVRKIDAIPDVFRARLVRL